MHPRRFKLRSPLLLAAACAALWSAPGAAQVSIGGGGVEKQSRAAFQQMKAHIPQSTNARAIALVDCIARAVIAQTDPEQAQKDWEIVLFEHDAVNAFAMPGGKVGVFTGLFRVANNQHMVAAVLGHEIAHVTLKHAERRATRRTLTGLATGVATGVASAVLGGNIFTQRALSDVMGYGAEMGLNRPYDRGQETDADVRGLHYMAAAGFDPRATIELFKRMGRIDRNAPPEWASTHPSSDTRLDTLISNLAPTLATYNGAQAAGRGHQCQ
ncbi:MAG: M48 family metallopeptidase [Gammaproteobacteria bacterium]